MYTPSLTQQHTYFGVGSPCLSTKELLAHSRIDPVGAESGMHSAPPWGIRATFVASQNTLSSFLDTLSTFVDTPPSFLDTLSPFLNTLFSFLDTLTHSPPS